jgi:hypothetical protein
MVGNRSTEGDVVDGTLSPTTIIEGDDILVSYGDCLRPRVYNLHSRFARAINHMSGERIVTFVIPQVGGGPTNIVLSDIGWIDSRNIQVTANIVVIGNQAIALPVARRYHSGITLDGADMRRSVRNLGTLERILVESSPPLSFAFVLEGARRRHFTSSFDRCLAERVTEAWHLLQRLDVAEGVRQIRGTGYGLTPSGDDFVAGWVVGLRLLRDLFHRNTALELGVVARNAGTGNLRAITRTVVRQAFRAMMRTID